MFSSKEYLERKTGPYGIGRLSYLQSLVTEYQDTDDIDSKQQVLANLANFAYDPINYEHFRKLNILDLLLDGLDETDEKLVEFAVGGICNVCLDRQNKKHLLDNGVVPLVIKCLSRCTRLEVLRDDNLDRKIQEIQRQRPGEETVLSAVTSLMFLVTPESKPEITSLPVVECMLRFSQSKNKRLANLATVFIQDYCTSDQVNEARSIQQNMTSDLASNT